MNWFFNGFHPAAKPVLPVTAPSGKGLFMNIGNECRIASVTPLARGVPGQCSLLRTRRRPFACRSKQPGQAVKESAGSLNLGGKLLNRAPRAGGPYHPPLDGWPLTGGYTAIERAKKDDFMRCL
jgi:hypothetical protein